jgi:hypothetical protein
MRILDEDELELVSGGSEGGGLDPVQRRGRDASG